MSRRRRTPIRWNSRRSRRHDLSGRLKTATLILVVIWGILVLRSIDIAVLKHSDFLRLAMYQQTENLDITIMRGNIYDRSGEALSWNVPAPSVYAVPDEIADIRQAAFQLAGVCNVSKKALLGRFENKSRFCWVERAVSSERKSRVEKLNLKGVHFITEQKRGYRNGSAWRYLLGNTDIDGRGISGAEMAFDDILIGDGLRVRVNRDRQGRRFDLDGRFTDVPDNGRNVVLTIDAGLQDILSQKLKEGVERFQAKGAVGVFLEVGTSEVLAMSQYYPTGISATRNVAISDMYEPGSTFKLVTLAAAINSGQYSAYDIIDCEGGKISVGRKRITDHHKMGKVTLRRAVELSSNVAIVKIAREIGRDAWYKMAIDFGFAAKTGIDLPGESAGIIHDPESWSEIEQATVAFGNGLTVTALQMANAYAAVGAGGELYRPHILKGIANSDGEIIEFYKPTRLRRVVSERTAATLMEFFSGVVDSGTAVLAKIDGLKIAGKTGTSRKAIIGGRGYHRDKFLSSFVGLYPADSPVIVGYILFDEPMEQKMASRTAVPVFKEILMEYLCSPRGVLDIEEDGLDPQLDLCAAGDLDGVYSADEIDLDGGTKLIKDFDELNQIIVGKPLRKAVRFLHRQGYEVIFDGVGVVRECYPRNDDGKLRYFLKCG